MVDLFILQTDVSSCEQIVNDTQCKDESKLEGGCTWIYKNNDTTTNGICVKKDTNAYSCENLNRTDQCEDGAFIRILSNGECKLYPDDSNSDVYVCKNHCIKLVNGDCKARQKDCFWLDENTTVSEDPPGEPVEEKCVNKVCINIYIYMYIYYFTNIFFITPYIYICLSLSLSLCVAVYVRL